MKSYYEVYGSRFSEIAHAIMLVTFLWHLYGIYELKFSDADESILVIDKLAGSTPVELPKNLYEGEYQALRWENPMIEDNFSRNHAHFRVNGRPIILCNFFPLRQLAKRLTDSDEGIVVAYRRMMSKACLIAHEKSKAKSKAKAGSVTHGGNSKGDIMPQDPAEMDHSDDGDEHSHDGGDD